MDNSILGKLPIEARTMIYQEVFEANGVCSDGTIELTIEYYPHRQSNFDKVRPRKVVSASAPPNGLAVTEVCREVRAESMEALFLNSKIHVDLSLVTNGVGNLMRSLEMFEDWLRANTNSQKAKQLVFYDPDACIFCIDDEFATISWWNVLNWRVLHLKALLPQLKTPIAVLAQQNIVDWVSETTCDAHWTARLDHLHAHSYRHPMKLLLDEAYPDEDISQLGEILINVEDKHAAHQDIDNHCDAIKELWSRVMIIRDPETVDDDAPKCCRKKRYRKQLRLLRRGYHQLVDGGVGDAPDEEYCCGRS